MDASLSLACKRCHQPLLRDTSVASLTPSQYGLIANNLPAPQQPSSLPPAGKLAALPPASRPAAAAWAAANPPITESYVFLPDAGRGPAAHQQHQPPRPPSATSTSTVVSSTGSPSASRPESPALTPSTAAPAAPPALAAKLDALLSSRTAIDHPLCAECTDLFQAELQRELEELTRERDAYIAFERGLRKRSGAAAAGDDGGGNAGGMVGTSEEWDALVARKKDLEDEESKLRAALKERETELAAVKDNEARMRDEEAAVDRDEAAFLTSHAALAGQLSHLAHTLSSAKTQLLLSTYLLQHLENTNVYNDAFQIGHAPLADASGKSSVSVGTINGLRLGGRPAVDWDESNAAWGLVALCIDRLAVKVGCKFETYKIVPLGSFSRIEDIPGKGVYELYASSDISPARLLQNRRFSYALVALLDCLRQLVDFGRRNGRAWGTGTGVEISKDKINGHSIRMPGLTSGVTLGSMSLMGFGGAATGGAAAPTETAADKSKEGNADEQWTRACRNVLGVLKRILVVESEADRTS